MDASIIVLTKNAGQNFPALLQRLFAQKFQGSYEVLVIDSGSTDATLAAAQQHPVKITAIMPQQFHHGKTRNLGASLAAGKYLVYITQDALPQSNTWLQKLIDAFNNPLVAMVCGRQLSWETTKPPEKFFYYYFFPSFKIAVTGDDPDYFRDNMFISNVNSALRKDIWQQFEFSKTALLGEDKEFAKRILSRGWHIVYQPEAVVYHAHNHSIASIFRRGVQAGIALRQGVAGLPQSRGNIITKGLNYWKEECNYLKTAGYLHWLPWCIIYDIARYTGNFCGRRGWLV